MIVAAESVITPVTLLGLPKRYMVNRYHLLIVLGSAVSAHGWKLTQNYWWLVTQASCFRVCNPRSFHLQASHLYTADLRLPKWVPGAEQSEPVVKSLEIVSPHNSALVPGHRSLQPVCTSQFVTRQYLVPQLLDTCNDTELQPPWKQCPPFTSLISAQHSP